MLKIAITFSIITALLLLPLRFAVSTGGFFRDGVIEGIQSCKVDSDCIWAPTGCCDCYEGGREMLINKDKELLYNVLVKDICMGEQPCGEENTCHDEEVFCDRTCKFGKRTYTKPLLTR